MMLFESESPLVAELASASRALGTFEGALRALPRADALVQPLLRREAVASSRLEGIEASLADLALFESSGTPATERDDVREVANGVVILQKALAGETDAALQAKGVPSLVVAGIRHQHVSGDGRHDRARLLADIGAFFDLSSYFVAHEEQYVAARAGAQEEWLTFFLRAVREASSGATTHLLHLRARLDEWRQRVASARNAAALEPVLENLLAIPATTGARLAEMMNVTYPAARKTIDSLVERGVLAPTSIGKRHYFVANVWD